MYCNWSFSYRSILFIWQCITSHHLIPVACSKSMTKDRHEHFSPLSSMVERLSGGRGSVKCEAAAAGGPLAPPLTEPRPPGHLRRPKARCRLRRGGRVLLAARCGPPTHRLAAQLDAMGVVNDAVQQSVGISGVLVEPAGHRDLGDQDRRRPVMPVVNHL